jgi:GAF domain-containing protein
MFWVAITGKDMNNDEIEASYRRAYATPLTDDELQMLDAVAAQAGKELARLESESKLQEFRQTFLAE